MKIKDRIGEKYLTNQGYLATVINYKNQLDCDIEFESGVILYNISFKELKRGNINNPYHKSVCGIGYYGIGKYKSRIEGVKSKEYVAWVGMLSRCYNFKIQKRRPWYIDCSVDERWHNFQNFAQWYKDNYNPKTMQGFHLDKDILIKGNKVYSPETCCFVPHEINSLLIKCNSRRGILPLGVSYDKKDNLYISSVKNVTHRFNTVEEAFESYKTIKEQYIKEIANKYKNSITLKTYSALYNYKVEITD